MTAVNQWCVSCVLWHWPLLWFGGFGHCTLASTSLNVLLALLDSLHV